MADEFKHLSAGTSLTQGEYEAVGGHVFACQAAGDILYASSSSQLSRVGKGTNGEILQQACCKPDWTNTPSLNALTVDDVNIDGKVVTLTGSACDTIVMTAAANGAFSLVTTDTAAAAANITITADGTVEIDSTGTLTLDASTDIVLDADGDNITFKAGSGDSTGLDFSNSSGTWTIKPGTANADLIFNVNDGCVDTKVMAIDAGDSVVTFGGNSVKSGEIRILEDTDSGANYTAFKVGNIAANVTYTLPTNVAASCGLFLKSTCAGVLSWAAAGGGDLSFAGDCFGADKVIGSNDNYALAFETNNTTRMHIDNCGKIGIGETTPAALLHVKVGDSCLAPATGAIAFFETDSSSAYISIHGACDSTGGLQFGNDGGSATAAQFLMHPGQVDIRIGGDLEFRVASSGNITGTHGTYHTSSDIRTKENIINSDVGLTTLMQMRPIKFNFLENRRLGTRTRLGFIAQEIESLVPEVVHTADTPDGDILEMKAIEDMQLIPILVKAIQELKVQVDAI